MTGRQVCPKCKGDGDLPGKIDPLTGVLSLGLMALMDMAERRVCSVCDGRGYLVTHQETTGQGREG